MSGGRSLHIELGWPAEQLSPNSRAHHMVLHRFKKAAKTEAQWATKIAMPFDWAPAGETIKVHLIAHPKPTGPHPDADNFIASCKAALDGIATALGVNDRTFEAPTVEWADRCQRGKLIVVIS
jgi:crossover junction endodeoxyribonuclease RusA